MTPDSPKPLGPPWERPLAGRLDHLVIESDVLRENPLGDPHVRPLYVYVPPGFTEPLPTIYVIQGMTGQLDMWLNRNAYEPTMVERVDELFSRADVPKAFVIFVDAWTSYGGSQFINSSATGRYMDYLCDEVVPFVDSRYPTNGGREHRALTGKSSGGYGAMVVPMLRADVFGALASHAGDALFEVCYLPEFRETVRILRDHFEGSYEVFFDRLRTTDHLEFKIHGAPLNSYAMAACYSPDDSEPGKVILPFDIATGRLDYEIWQRWLRWDPVRLAPMCAESLKSMRRIYLDGGKKDEYYLDLGALAFARELDAIGVDYTLDLFDGGHMGIAYRYPQAIQAMAEAIS